MAQKPATTRIPRQLRESDVHGKGAAEIGWGTPGDFDRCRAFMRRHDVPGYEIDGACANLHRIATGEWPGRNAHKGHLATAAVISLVAAAATDTANLIRWEGPLARIDSPTGDRRQFPRDTLTYQSFPQPYRFQRQGFQGHQGAVTVGVIEDAAEKDVDAQLAKDHGIEPGRYVWGNGYFLDSNIVPEVKEAVHHIEHGVGGPSVDLDSFTAVLSKNLAGETVANMKRGRMRAATQVSVPAFADLRLKVMRPKELTAAGPSSEGSTDTANLAVDATFAVNAKGWQNAPIAPREALFDADDAAKRIEAWAQGDPDKMASVFLWIADSPDAPLIGRRGYRLPWGDIIDGKPYLIFHAVYAAAALLQGAHGGLPAIPEDQKGQLRSVITSIYEKMADEFGDDSIVAPWDRVEQQQAAGTPCADGTADEYESYVSSFDAALEEFRRTHRYTERKHPRVPGKPGGRANKKVRNPKGGEWVDTPHGPHGQIKVGNKWVYPPKRGEKGYRNPEKAVKGIAERGGGKGPGKRAGTHVVKKARPEAPVARKAAPQHKKRGPDSVARSHVEAMQGKNRLGRQEYLKDLSDSEIDNLVKHLGGTRHEDDSRDDLEIEILHQMERDRKDNDTSAEREKDKERAKGAREISHGGGRKTTIGTKKPAPKPKDEDTKKPAPKPEPKPEPEAKKPPVKKPATKKPSTTTVGKKEHKLTPAQQKALENVRDNGGNAKVHPATRKVLEREGYLDSDGKLTDKGRSHVGAEKPKGGDDQGASKPKPSGGKTTVGKKEYKLTPAQQKALENLGKDPGAKVHPATRKVLEREGYLDSDGKLTDKGRDHAGVKDQPGEESKAPKPEPKGEDAAKPTPKPEPPKSGDAKKPKKKLTKIQEDALLYLGGHTTSKPDPTLIPKISRAVLEREGYIDADGKLTDEGRALFKDLVAKQPKPVSVPGPPPAPKRGKLGPVGGRSPRPKPQLPKLPSSKETEGKFRPKAQTRRERDLEYLQEELEMHEARNKEFEKSWLDGIARAKASGEDPSYWESGLANLRDRQRQIKQEMKEIRERPHSPNYYDEVVEDPHVKIGTPTPEQIEDHLSTVMDPRTPVMFRDQVHDQMAHQASFVPRSVMTVRGLMWPRAGSGSSFDDPGYSDTMAYYVPMEEKMYFSPRWTGDVSGMVKSSDSSIHSGWWVSAEDGTTPIEHTMAHEFGHHVAFRAMANPEAEKLYKKIVDEYELPPATKLDYHGVEAAIKAAAARMGSEVSRYGATMLHEFLAEIWLEYTNGGQFRRDKSTRVAELMRELAEGTRVRI